MDSLIGTTRSRLGLFSNWLFLDHAQEIVHECVTSVASKTDSAHSGHCSLLKFETSCYHVRIASIPKIKHFFLISICLRAAKIKATGRMRPGGRGLKITGIYDNGKIGQGLAFSLSFKINNRL